MSTLEGKTIAFIGAGNMAEALVRGLLAADIVKPDQIIAADVAAERRALFEKTYKVCTVADNTAAVAPADIVVLAVKPQQLGTVLANLKSQLANQQFLLSITAGVPTARIERELGGQPRVIRAMPNTPALVGQGAAALCRGAHATEEDLATAEAILDAVGITVRVEESLMDAVTALSGSGPAYVFLVAEAMIAAGVQLGLDEATARRLAVQTVAGAGKLLADSGESPGALRRKVTSPGGTTEAAIKVMTERRLVEIFSEAIQAAARRGKDLAAG